MAMKTIEDSCMIRNEISIPINRKGYKGIIDISVEVRKSPIIKGGFKMLPKGGYVCNKVFMVYHLGAETKEFWFIGKFPKNDWRGAENVTESDIAQMILRKIDVFRGVTDELIVFGKTEYDVKHLNEWKDFIGCNRVENDLYNKLLKLSVASK